MAEVLEVPITGMDCAECTRNVHDAIARLPGVENVEVYLGSEKAVVQLDPARVGLTALRQAVNAAGYGIGETRDGLAAKQTAASDKQARNILLILGAAFSIILFVVIAGEWLGLFEKITARVPWYIGWAAVLAAGFPIFVNVVRATLRRQVISHTLMTLGVLAALAVGQWTTAAVVVFFMRTGDAVEKYTTGRSRKALKDLAATAPRTARLQRGGEDVEVSIDEVKRGDIVVMRPGEQIPVDGLVMGGKAAVDQAAVTGESLPIDAVVGTRVYAASMVRAGSIKIRTSKVGEESTFGRIIHLVEEAEGSRGRIQLAADRFSARFLPIVAAIALLTLVIRRDPLAAAAVLVVACSCSIALATPIAVLATIGAGARKGIIYKGGKTIEQMAAADTLLVDKTGTLTLGRLQITDFSVLDGRSPADVLQLAASAERYSEHPLAEAVRRYALTQKITLLEPEDFTSEAGVGVSARVNGQQVSVGKDPTARMADGDGQSDAGRLAAEGKSLLYVTVDGEPSGLLAAQDTLRPDVKHALDRFRSFGITHIELLSGDQPRAVSSLAEELGISWQAGLSPEDKIDVVRRYQTAGKRVIMVGDGINDAPALAQADVGIAMAGAGTAIANEAAHVILMREDWNLVPEAVASARRTMRVVRINLVFTAIYNLLGLSLAAAGILPAALAAAAQSLPDIGVMLNSGRLLYQPRSRN